MSQDENSFVDDLLKGLPKAPPRTKMEQLRMEKFIDEQIATLKAERTQAKSSVYVRFQTQFQLAAGFLVLVGGIAFAINFSSSNFYITCLTANSTTWLMHHHTTMFQSSSFTFNTST